MNLLRVHARSSLLVVLFSSLLLLLLLAGVLMYRWVNRVSEADRLQQKEFLETAMRSFEGEFSGAIREVLWTFRPVLRLQPNTALEFYIAELHSQWQSTATRPQLVGTLSIGTTTPDGAIIFRRYQREEGQFENQEWPVTLGHFRDMLEQRTHMERGQSSFPPPRVALALSEDRPVIVLPLLAITPSESAPPTGFVPPSRSLIFPPPVPSERSDRPDQTPPPGIPSSPQMRPPGVSGWENPSARLIGWCFLQLDLEFLQKEFLPALVKRHFGGAGLSSYRLAVVTGSPQRVVYPSDPALPPESLAVVDATAPLFRPYGRFGFGPPPFNGLREQDARGRAFTERLPDPAANFAQAQGAGARSEADAWLLLAKHESGSIETFVNAARRRNLMVGFGVLLLLGSSMALLVLTTQRARALAKREMEFVAGVSHELRTPLTVLQSAGFNLTRGVVKDSSRVQQYGAVIQTEARRLTDMVEQVLSYAGIQSGRKRYELKPTPIPEIVDRALAEYAAAFDEAGWTVVKEIEADLPPVLADASALESALKNLLQNVLRYASTGKWLRLSARATRGKRRAEVEVTVEDRGPGIDPLDLPHIFEPFYRGQKIMASTIPGAGLGLSLLRRHVKAHRGRVTVKTSPGNGAAFTLHLPALSNPEVTPQPRRHQDAEEQDDCPA